MKELSIHISESNMNGFFMSLKKNSWLIYRRKSSEEDTFYSVILNEISQNDRLKVKVIWNNRLSLLIPSPIFRIENINDYLSSVSSFIVSPQCIQYGEVVAVWDTDIRIETFNQISQELSVPIIHTHQRIEHIACTPDNTISYTLFDELLYITEKRNGRLYNSFVAKVQNVNDVLYYMLHTANKDTKINVSLPDNWIAVIKKYF